MPTIRDATVNDYKAIRRLLDSALFDTHNIWKDEIMPGLDGSNSDWRCAVYVTGGKVVAVIVWYERDDHTYAVRWVAVHKDYKSTGRSTGSGIGKALVAHVTSMSSKTKVESRPEVESWYRRQGFETDSTDADNALKRMNKTKRRR